MPVRFGELARRGGTAAAKAYRKLEMRVLAHEGRKAVRARARRAAAVAKKAAKAGALAGAVTAALVVKREARKRRARES
jgi:hypothetical protein